MKTVDKLTWGAVIAVAAFAIAVFAGPEVMKRAERAKRDRAEPWRLSPDWQGTNLSAKVSAPSAVLDAFAADPPAPAGRKTLFAPFFDGSAGLPCQGWYGSIDS